jgi:hypothetical protein
MKIFYEQIFLCAKAKLEGVESLNQENFDQDKLDSKEFNQVYLEKENFIGE